MLNIGILYVICILQFLKHASFHSFLWSNIILSYSHLVSAIDITPGDTKALFRLCQALEHMGKSEQAFQEARKLIHLEPKNTAVQQMLMRLTVCVSEKVSFHFLDQFGELFYCLCDILL